MSVISGSVGGILIDVNEVAFKALNEEEISFFMPWIAMSCQWNNEIVASELAGLMRYNSSSVAIGYARMLQIPFTLLSFEQRFADILCIHGLCRVKQTFVVVFKYSERFGADVRWRRLRGSAGRLKRKIKPHAPPASFALALAFAPAYWWIDKINGEKKWSRRVGSGKNVTTDVRPIP